MLVLMQIYISIMYRSRRLGDTHLPSAGLKHAPGAGGRGGRAACGVSAWQCAVRRGARAHWPGGGRAEPGPRPGKRWEMRIPYDRYDSCQKPTTLRTYLSVRSRGTRKSKKVRDR